MKRRFLFANLLTALLVASGLTALSGQPVFNGDVVFSTQAEIDNWNPAFTTITGKLLISGDDITDLRPLANIVSVGRENTSDPADADGLSVRFCPLLTSLSGLNGITTISGDLDIITNESLTNLDALASVQSVGSAVPDGGTLQVNRNISLTSIAGLSGISGFTGNLVVQENDVLPNLEGLNNLVSLRSLKLIINPEITTLDALAGLSAVAGALQISDNTSLSDCCAIADLLGTPGAVGGIVAIFNNQTGCENQTGILTTCTPPADDDDDCDGVPNTDDLCPGGDDTVDNNHDGQPDCAFPPSSFNQVLPAWRCGSRKVLVCHHSIDGTTNTLCIKFSAVANHLAHGDYLGPCGSASCGSALRGAGSQPGLALENVQYEEDSENQMIGLYPNPAFREAWIDLSAFSGGACQVRLMDIRGAVLKTIGLPGVGDEPLRLDLGGLAPGLYLVQVKPDHAGAQTLKLVITE